MCVTLDYKNISGSDSWATGSGKSLVVIHGGPGLDHSYLVDPLCSLSDLRRVIFYNQLGCGNCTKLPVDFVIGDLVSQFAEIVRDASKENPVDVIAHSWGAYIFYEAIKSAQSLNIDRAILVSPVGLTRDRFDGSGERLISRIPEEVLSGVESMEAEGKGADLMKILAPYYFAKPRNDVELKFGSYNSDTYAKIVECLGQYDCRGVVDLLPQETTLIYGDSDIELPIDTNEIHSRASVVIIPGAGHFSFAEQPGQFMATVRKLLSN